MGQATEGSAAARRRRRPLLLLILALLILILLCILLWAIFLRPRPAELVANPNGPYITGEAQPVTFDGSGSTGTNIVTYAWDFGDNTTGDGVSPSHTYNDGPDQFTVTLTVTDSQGRSASATTQVTVNNLAPMAEAGGPYECFVGQTIQLSGSCTDPSPIDSATLSCTWADFSGAAISEPNYVCPGTPGDVIVTLTATDKDGASAQDSATVTVKIAEDNLPPQAKITVNLRDKSGRIFRFNASGSIDPDGQIVSYEWDFGDGKAGTGVEIIHEYDTVGTYKVTLTVTDDKGAKGTATVNVP